MEIGRFDFGKKYSTAILEYKLRDFQREAPYSVVVSSEEDNTAVTINLKFFNSFGEEIVGGDVVRIPKGTPLDSMALNYETKELVIVLEGSDPIVADFSGLLNDVIALQTEIDGGSW